MAVDILSFEETVNKIIKLNKGLDVFWSDAGGWGPDEAVELLSKSRLDWQVSLSHRLHDVSRVHTQDEDQAKLIESWSRLGTLVENSMKLALSVYLLDYRESEKDRKGIKDKSGKIKDPDELTFEPLKVIFMERIALEEHGLWLTEIQNLRNSIHSFRHREIHSWDKYK